MNYDKSVTIKLINSPDTVENLGISNKYIFDWPLEMKLTSPPSYFF